jgi:hypothetical protein
VRKASAMAPTVSKTKAIVKQYLPSALSPTEAAKEVVGSIASSIIGKAASIAYTYPIVLETTIISFQELIAAGSTPSCEALGLQDVSSEVKIAGEPIRSTSTHALEHHIAPTRRSSSTRMAMSNTSVPRWSVSTSMAKWFAVTMSTFQAYGLSLTATTYTSRASSQARVAH